MRSISGTGITLAVLGILCFLMLWSDKWRGGNWKHTIASDGNGYYAYLPALFIYQDLNYSFFPEIGNKYFNNASQAYFAPETNGRRVNKYFGGVALMMAPFFLLSLAFSSMLGLDADGYSLLFQTGVNIAALFYYLAGLWFLRKTLKTYFMPEWIVVAVILAIGIGTNLLYYTIAEASMSHVYSFCAFSVFIYLCRRILAEYSRKRLFLTAVVFGLILFIRPSNGMILLALPFLSDSAEQFRTLFKNIFSDLKAALIAITVALIIPCIQLLLYYGASGQFFLWSYQGEGFEFSHPEIMNVLFSWRKGLFIYTPILLICLLGLIPLFRKNVFSAVSFLGFFLLTTFVISSWWNWWYGGSFGMRPYIEYYSLFGILLAILLRTPHLVPRTLSLVSLFLLLSLNLLQSWQAYRAILPWDMMTAQKYRNIFLKTNDIYRWIYTDELFPPPAVRGKQIYYLKNDLDPGLTWHEMGSVTKGESFSGSNASKLDDKVLKSVCYIDTLKRLIPDSIMADQVLLRVMTKMTDLSSDACLVFSVVRKDSNLCWYGFPLIRQVLEKDQWTKYEKILDMPRDLQPEDKITFYVLKQDKSVVYVDDFEMILFGE